MDYKHKGIQGEVRSHVNLAGQITYFHHAQLVELGVSLFDAAVL